MPQKYIRHFPEPLLEDLINGRWLPVIGAGMSLNATLPKNDKMPLWNDLANTLAKELRDYDSTGVLDAISAYEHEYGRARLIERLVQLLRHDKAKPGRAHKEFCSLPFDIVCTTNFDFLLEKQYEADYQFNRSIHPVVDEDQLSINIHENGTLLLKLHGDLRHPNRLVVTEEDYDGFLTNYPLVATYLANQLITKTAVFVGYSLDDPDFRQIWHVVSNRLGKTRRMAYAILVDARPGEIARFQRRGVKVVNLPGSRAKYGDTLAIAFQELREFRRDNAGSVLKPTEEKPLEQLLLPRNALSRLCFFSLQIELQPFYRENIFPVVEAAGFVPVTLDDVVNLGDSISAMIDSLIDRAVVVVVDLGSVSSANEVKRILSGVQRSSSEFSRSDRQLILVTATDEEDHVPLMELHHVVSRRTNVSEVDDNFIEMFSMKIRNIARKMGIEQTAEPQRLFESGEYRAAVISAMTLLESVLRERLQKPPGDQVRRPMSLRQLVENATESGIIADSQAAIFGWMKLRNQAVHSTISISRQQADTVVSGVNRIVAES